MVNLLNWLEFFNKLIRIFVLINNNLDTTFKQIVKILETERLKLSKQFYLSDFVKKLN